MPLTSRLTSVPQHIIRYGLFFYPDNSRRHDLPSLLINFLTGDSAFFRGGNTANRGWRGVCKQDDALRPLLHPVRNNAPESTSIGGYRQHSVACTIAGAGPFTHPAPL